MSEDLKPGLRLAKTLSLFDQLLADIQAKQTYAQAHDFSMKVSPLDQPGIGQDFAVLGEDKMQGAAPIYVPKAAPAIKAQVLQLHHDTERVPHASHPRVRHHEPEDHEHTTFCHWPRVYSNPPRKLSLAS